MWTGAALRRVGGQLPRVGVAWIAGVLISRIKADYTSIVLPLGILEDADPDVWHPATATWEVSDPVTGEVLKSVACGMASSQIGVATIALAASHTIPAGCWHWVLRVVWPDGALYTPGSVSIEAEGWVDVLPAVAAPI